MDSVRRTLKAYIGVATHLIARTIVLLRPVVYRLCIARTNEINVNVLNKQMFE